MIMKMKILLSGLNPPPPPGVKSQIKLVNLHPIFFSMFLYYFILKAPLTYVLIRLCHKFYGPSLSISELKAWSWKEENNWTHTELPGLIHKKNCSLKYGTLDKC